MLALSLFLLYCPLLLWRLFCFLELESGIIVVSATVVTFDGYPSHSFHAIQLSAQLEVCLIYVFLSENRARSGEDYSPFHQLREGFFCLLFCGREVDGSSGDVSRALRHQMFA